MEVNNHIGLVERSFELGQQLLSARSNKHRKEHGQYLTPPALARFMASQLGSIPTGSRVLDPSVGSGTLICAVIEQLINVGIPCEVWIDGYDIDPAMTDLARRALQPAIELAEKHDIRIHLNLIESDFVLAAIQALWPPLLPDEQHASIQTNYDFIIANPPYFKLNRDDPRAKATNGRLKGNTNIYTVFMGLSQRLISLGGRGCFIVPRSFCSGAYFAGFRSDMLERIVPTNIHLFESRHDAFKADDVLQENIIIAFRPKVASDATESLFISVSRDTLDLPVRVSGNSVSMKHFIGLRGKGIVFRLPTGELDLRLLDVIDLWPGSLSGFGLEISTGPIVPFRTRESLALELDVFQERAAPLLWMSNVKPQLVEWPVSNGKRTKFQGFLMDGPHSEQLVPVSNFVLLRRFSAKEEPRRLIAAPLLSANFAHSRVGLENHLNYIYRQGNYLTDAEAVGLSALLNSGIIDRYFRISNGNTQVNAADLRGLPLPSLDAIKLIGNLMIAEHHSPANADLDKIVVHALQQDAFLPSDFPIIRETRARWAK